jgi:hypothetical protein
MISQASKVFIDEGRELGESAVITLAPIHQELGHFLRGRQRHIAKLPSSPAPSKLGGPRASGKNFQFR